MRQRSLLTAGLFLTLLTVGCEPEPQPQDKSVRFDVTPNHTSIVQGEIVTFTTSSANTAGRDTRIDWHTTGGKLETEQDNQIARVRFDEPGRYVVTGSLVVDGRSIRSDAVEINVLPQR